MNGHIESLIVWYLVFSSPMFFFLFFTLLYAYEKILFKMFTEKKSKTPIPLPLPLPSPNAILSRILFPARRPELVSKCYPKCHPPKRSPPILQITLRSPVCNLSDIYFYFNAV